MLKEYKVFFNIKNKVLQFFIFLQILSILGLLTNIQEKNVIINFISINLISIGYLGFAKVILKDRFINPFNSYISALILFLIIHVFSDDSLFFIPFILVTTILVNRLIRFTNQPIFNPIALGIFILYFIFYILFALGFIQSNIFISWWSASLVRGVEISVFSIVVTIFLLVAFLYFGIKFNKIYYSLITIIIFLIIQFALFHDLYRLLGLISGNLFFLAFIMLSEPKTSPTKKKTQIVFGLIAGILYSLLYLLDYNDRLIDFGNTIELILILIMNIIYFITKKLL
jgi:hypothetical protein